MTKENNFVKVEKIAGEFFEKLGIDGKVVCQKQDDYIAVNFSTPQPAILIGYHGQTLACLQLLLSLVISKKLGQENKIVLDISDWRKRREEVLKQLAGKNAARAVDLGQPVKIDGLKPFERRIIHLALADNPQVSVHSEGEEGQRVIIIESKASQGNAS